MPPIIKGPDGRTLHVEFDKKLSILDLKKTEDTFIQLTWMIVKLEERLLALENRR